MALVEARSFAQATDLAFLAGSEHPAAIRDLPFGSDQHDCALRVGKAQREDFRHQRADLPWRKVDDGRHLTADQRFWSVILRQLSRRFLYPDQGAEIDEQLERGLARFRKRLGLDDGADADVDREKLLERDLRGGRGYGHRCGSRFEI